MGLKQTKPSNPHAQQRSGGDNPGTNRGRPPMAPTNMMPGTENLANRSNCNAMGARMEGATLRNQSDTNRPIG